MTWFTAWIVAAGLAIHSWSPSSAGPIRLKADLARYGYASAPQSDSVERARVDFDAGRYAQAARALEAITTANTRDATAYYWLGRARLEERDYHRAVDALTRAVILSPDDADYRRWLARAAAEIADREHSFSMARLVRQELEQAVRIDPSNLDVRRDLMGFYLEAPWLVGGGDGKAKTQIEAIIRLDPVAGHLARGAYWRHKKDTARARAEYEAVLKAAPSTISPYLEAAEFYEQSEDAAGLRKTIEDAQKIDPGEPQLLYFRGVLGVLNRTDLDKAEEALQTYLERVPRRSDRPEPAAVHEWLGRLYEALERPDQAMTELRKALAFQSDRDSARVRLRRLEQQRRK